MVATLVTALVAKLIALATGLMGGLSLIYMVFGGFTFIHR